MTDRAAPAAPDPAAAPGEPDALDALVREAAREPGAVAPFALLHRPGADPGTVELLRGPVHDAGSLEALSAEARPAGQTLLLVPFRTAAAYGLRCRDDGAPLLAMSVRERARIPHGEALLRLPDLPLTVRDGGFDPDDAAYGAIVRRVVDERIGAGEGCNFVISRSFTGTIDGWTPAHALSVFRRLLAGEQGAYWTFVVHTGSETFVGASPECHVRLDGGVASMNPISGTYRYPPEGPALAGLLDFLSDAKETDELYMVLDEELKTMGAVCERGACAEGPYLKEMAHLAHTEYVITGRTRLSAVEVLRRTLFAPTVVGSPLVNAFRVIGGYEQSGRGYYSGVVALIGRDGAGRESLDSAIMIRTAQVGAAGGVRLGVGASLVRHSSPDAEVAETRAKARGLLAGMGYGGRKSGVAERQGTARRPGGDGRPYGRVPALVRRPVLGRSPEVRRALAARNDTLGAYWFADEDARSAGAGTGALAGLRLLVVDAEDRFTTMLGHQLRSLGTQVTIRSYRESFTAAGCDCVLVGPGPGDPLDLADPKIGRLHAIVRGLLAGDLPFLAVCLGHQVLGTQLGLDVVRLARPNQGVQREIDLFGVRRKVGLYNTFAALSGSDRVALPDAPEKIEVSRDGATGEVHALRGPRFGSMQFHPESVLTQDGPRILADALGALTALHVPGPPAGSGPPAAPVETAAPVAPGASPRPADRERSHGR